MCGRYTNLTPQKAYADLFGVQPLAEDLAPRYNIAPSDTVLACRSSSSGRELALLRWGLVPRWSRTAAAGPINARAETVAEKPLFREAFRRRRCLVAADGFYEWKPEGRRKQPWYFRLRGGQPFGFAGLWESRREPGGGLMETCAIVVTDANHLVAPVHDRMPVILAPEHFETWLGSDDQAPERLLPLLRPFPENQMESWPVSPAVNRAGVEGPQLVARLAPREG